MSGIGNYYQPVKDKIVFTDSGDIFNVALFFEEEKIGNKITGVCAHGNGTLFCNWDANVFWFDYINAPVLVHQGATFGSTSCSENEVIIAINGGESYCVYNISDRFISNKLEKITNVVFCLHFGRFVFTNQSNDSVYCNNKDTGALLWHFDVTEPGRYREWYPEGPEHPGVVTKFLGVWQRRLYVAVSNGLIIELELESGRLLRSWQQLPDGITLPPSGWDKLHGLELAFLDAAAGEIACVTHQYYWHIDLESGALHFHDLREHFSAAQLQVSPPAGDPAFDAEHIYFASEFHQYDGQSGANVYQLAALHRRSARIVWQQQVELPQSCQWKQHPVLDDRRLYALSHDLARSSEGGTLHIFERTE